MPKTDLQFIYIYIDRAEEIDKKTGKKKAAKKKDKVLKKKNK